MSVIANSAAASGYDGSSSSPFLLDGRRQWTAYAAFWLFLTIVTSAGGLLLEDGELSLADVRTMFANHASFWFVWSLLTLLAYAASTFTVPLRPENLGKAAVVHAALVLAAAAALTLYYTAAGIGAPNAAHTSVARVQEEGFDHDALWFLTINAALLAFVSLTTTAVRHHRRAQLKEAEQRARELENQRLAAAVSEARLTTLRGQIHPHFIFNALNSIASLVEAKKSDRAYDAITSLADILRSTFQSLEREAIRLEEEFALIRHMFELGSLRFGDRFTWSLDLPDELKLVQVQPFVIQPLAENALLHAVGRSSRPVHVQVRAARAHGRIVLEVADDGPGRSAEATGEDKGVGLRNLRERLRLAGGTLSLSTGATGFVAAVVVPAPEEGTQYDV